MPTPKTQATPNNAKDTIEYGLTTEVKTRHGSFWAKVSYTSSVQHDETLEAAFERIATFVVEKLTGEVKKLS
jgi:hypothetical protein